MSLPDIDRAVYQKLIADSTLVSAVGGTIDPRIYAGFAPQNVTLPYIVFNSVAGGPDNMTRRQAFEQLYQIDYIANSRAEAQTGGSLVYGALHRQQMTLTGWSNYRSLCVRNVLETDTPGGEEYYRKCLDFEFGFSQE